MSLMYQPRTVWLSEVGEMAPLVGVVALQGGFAEHIEVLESLGANTRRVRRSADLQGLDGIVLPGGESTVIDKLMRSFSLAEPLKDAVRRGLPVLATCAGLVVLATDLEDAAKANTPSACSTLLCVATPSGPSWIPLRGPSTSTGLGMGSRLPSSGLPSLPGWDPVSRSLLSCLTRQAT